ncbi:hypothetical protein, partial [Streptomyces sp. NPDC127574]
MKKACAVTIATAAAVALAAGMTSPASAKAEQATASKAQLTSKHRLTLITGDRVVLDSKGRAVGLEPAKGREHIPVQTRRTAGHTYVVPADV